MIISFLYFVLALLGLSFLIFIHELGHYFMAKKVGMKIEVFSIGLGKSFFSWTFQGVKWQLCYLPFGGYVKIAGEKEQAESPAALAPDSFFGKSPFARIKVAFMGPIVNIVFALIAFTAIWSLGGKKEPFSKNTNIIGFVDPKSELYKYGVRPGDQILKYNGSDFNGFKDLMYASVMNQKLLKIEGLKIDYVTGEKKPFDYVLTPYTDPRVQDKKFTTVGVMSPASALIYAKEASGSDFPHDASPMKNSGIEVGDRIVWACGEMIFSMPQLSSVINEPKSLLTVDRQGVKMLVKVPRLQIRDLRMKSYERGELEDWQHQNQNKGSLKDLFFIPYFIDNKGVVKQSLTYVGEDSELHSVYEESSEDRILKVGDHIIGVDGESTKNGYDIFAALQQKRVKMIVQRGFSDQDLTWKNENEKLIHSISAKDLTLAIDEIKNGHSKKSIGNLVVLSSVTPIRLADLPLSSTKKNWLTQELETYQKHIEKIKDKQERLDAQKRLDKSKQKLVLGLPLSDALVVYNPSPLTLFMSVLQETFKNLTSLITGKIHPKWMSGPIGMVQMMHHGWSLGFKEALFWMATISLNLGIFNLLPLPVLDGGHICFAFYEMITRKRLSPKVMEKLVIPFIAVLVALFVYVTYQDIHRLFSGLF